VSQSARPDVSVIISTRNRADSLRTTLESLTAADRSGIAVEIVVVDNGGDDDTEGVASSFGRRIPVTFVREPMVGKCHALNRGVSEARGEILAVLDDDMSVHDTWFQAVLDVCRRHPDKEIFGGTIRVAWPVADVPAWARNQGIRSEIFSAAGFSSESDLEGGQWFSGNHFWFRSRVWGRGVRFDDLWITEGKFQLDLIEMGCRGLSCPGAIADHRVQRELLRPDVVIGRARRVGIGFAQLRLQPYRPHVRSARMMHEHPLLSRAYCLGRHVLGRLRYAISLLYSLESDRFADRVIGIMWMTAGVEYLRVANQLEEYSIWKRHRAV